jgi:hypothetical protein
MYLGNLVVACASVTKTEGILNIHNLKYFIKISQFFKGVICRAVCSIVFAFGALLINALANKLKLIFKIKQPIITSILVALEIIMFIIVWVVGII